jgi:fructokinase
MRREAMLAVGVGEILWDRLPGGDEIGGAPLNVVSHLARFGHRAAYVTAVGQDRAGDAAIAEVHRRGIDTSLVGRADGVPTGLAQVTLGEGGSPAFVLRRPAAFEQWGDDDSVVARAMGMEPSFLVFGTLAQMRAPARAGLRRIAASCAGAVRLYDVNLRDGWWSAGLVAEIIGLASVVKLSESEASELAPALGVSWGSGADDPGGFSAGECSAGEFSAGEFSAEEFSRALAARYELRGVAVTAGPDAASLWLDGVFARAAPPESDVVDAVGAGDAFAAGLLDAIGQGLGAPAALRRANALGTLVASRRGAQPPWTEAELAELEAQSPPG